MSQRATSVENEVGLETTFNRPDITARRAACELVSSAS